MNKYYTKLYSLLAVCCLVGIPLRASQPPKKGAAQQGQPAGNVLFRYIAEKHCPKGTCPQQTGTEAKKRVPSKRSMDKKKR